MRTWGIREWLMCLFALLWGAVTVILTLRGSPIVEKTEWWASGVAVLLGIWKIFAPPSPPAGGE